MTKQQNSVLNALRVIGPILTFLGIVAIGVFILDVPLVLVVVAAWVLAAIEYASLTWAMRRKREAS